MVPQRWGLGPQNASRCRTEHFKRGNRWKNRLSPKRPFSGPDSPGPGSRFPPQPSVPKTPCRPPTQFLRNLYFSSGFVRNRPNFRVFLNPWFGEPMVCTLDSRGSRHFRGFRDFRESSTQFLVCGCLSCLRRFRDFRRSRERRPAPKP